MYSSRIIGRNVNMGIILNKGAHNEKTLDYSGTDSNGGNS
jgi:hypothetical protein